jgi:predicted negative regulator of RcsB-dependent stress response
MIRTANMSKILAAVLVAGIALVASAGWLMAQADQTNQDAEALAKYFQIGNRPTAITAEDAVTKISRFPSFGDKTVEALQKAAPIEKMSSLYALKNAGGRPLLNGKQIMLLLIFYKLQP